MTDLDWYFDTDPYAHEQPTRGHRLLEDLNDLTASHAGNCSTYGRLVDQLFEYAPSTGADELAGLPFLPAELFKTHRLKSVPDDEVFKELTSSGTTSQVPSRIVLDRETAKLQRKALATIMADFLGQRRRPMLIVDSESTLRRSDRHSARAAGILGMMNFGRDHTFVLDDEMNLDRQRLESFVDSHGDGPVLVFGFTYMIWKYLHRPIVEHDWEMSLDDAVVIHSGGWKALDDEAVSRREFDASLSQSLGADAIHNFYGMVEQVGSVYVECEEGYFHASSFSDVLIRDPSDWSVADDGERGLLQTLSVLPRSYPGHSLLTEDVGIRHGTDDCPCGRLGTRFTVHGRIETAELRGCSDVHAAGRAA